MVDVTAALIRVIGSKDEAVYDPPRVVNTLERDAKSPRAVRHS